MNGLIRALRAVTWALFAACALVAFTDAGAVHLFLGLLYFAVTGALILGIIRARRARMRGWRR